MESISYDNKNIGGIFERIIGRPPLIEGESTTHIATGTMNGMWQASVQVSGFLHNNDWIFVHKDNTYTKVVVVNKSEITLNKETPNPPQKSL